MYPKALDRHTPPQKDCHFMTAVNDHLRTNTDPHTDNWEQYRTLAAMTTAPQGTYICENGINLSTPMTEHK